MVTWYFGDDDAKRYFAATKPDGPAPMTRAERGRCCCCCCSAAGGEDEDVAFGGIFKGTGGSLWEAPLALGQEMPILQSPFAGSAFARELNAFPDGRTDHISLLF